VPAALVDTHCHLAFDAFDEDREAVVERAREAGVEACVVVSVDAASADRALAMAQACPGWAHATAGVHPTETLAGSLPEFEAVAERVAGGRFVAVGETGLDAFHDDVPLDVQQASLQRHLTLAVEHDLPVILHCRDAFDAMATALEPWHGTGLRGVLHCYTGTTAELPPLLDAGLHIGVGGIATFKANGALRDAVREVPADRLLVETDAPWLAPMPVRGRRNEPAFVAHVAACLAADRGMDLEAFAATTTANARGLFGLDSAAA
jgi:TatD DNase family protein